MFGIGALRYRGKYEKLESNDNSETTLTIDDDAVYKKTGEII